MKGFYFVNVPNHLKWVQVCRVSHAHTNCDGRCASPKVTVVLDFLSSPMLAGDLAAALNVHPED